MVKKIKSSACRGRWCDTHLFSMHSRMVMNSHCLQETIRLCPTYNRERKQLEAVMPKLNQDRKCYTPLFILQEDESLYVNHDERNRQIFENNKLIETHEITDIVTPFFYNSSELLLSLSLQQPQMMPRVSTARKYCKVCRSEYQEYLEHTASSAHRECLTKHPYSTFIVELARDFKLSKHQQKITRLQTNITFENQEPQAYSEIQSALVQKETGVREKQGGRDSQLNDFS